LLSKINNHFLKIKKFQNLLILLKKNYYYMIFNNKSTLKEERGFTNFLLMSGCYGQTEKYFGLL